MRIKYFGIYCVFIVLLAFHAAFGQTESADKINQDVSIEQIDWRIETLMKQARKLFEAYYQGDYAKYVEMSHPQVYEKDGAAKFYGEVEFVIDWHRSNDLLPITAENPRELFELLIDKRLFGVVAYKIEALSSDKKNKLTGLGSMVGISEDGGKSWKFAKGNAFNNAFPDVAGMFLIPNPVEKRFVNGIEQ